MSPAPAPGPETAPEIAPRPGRLRRLYQALIRFWISIRPGPETRKGSAAGALSGAAVVALCVGLFIQSGFGRAVDVAALLLAAALLAGATTLLVWLLLTALRRVHRWAAGAFVGAALVSGAAFGPQFGIPIGVSVALACGTLGATVATIRTGGFRHASRSKQVITVALCAFSVAAIAGAVAFLASDGTADALITPAGGAAPAAIRAENPGRMGPYGVQTLFYGSGTDRRRPEFRNVAIRTATVDASAFRKDLKGIKGWLRRAYWGFDLDKAPLNARVWYPVGPGPFPLALIVHGNHNMADHSDGGYAYLGELLASRGMILASVDENFLNAGLFADLGSEKSARGWMLLEHLRLWRDWNRTPGNPFQGKVDLNRLAVMGHSRGGEAAATAALFNRLGYYPDDATVRFPAYGFNIRSVVAIAPADGQYMPAGTRRTIENVNYLVLQGGHDADVSSFMGSPQFDRVRFTDGGPWFKSALFVYRANHGQFNTSWGRYDAGPPFAWFLNSRPLIDGDEQRRIAAVFISAFLEATLRERREYLPMFHDYRAAREWLPDTLCVSRFEDSTQYRVADFSEDVDVTTATLAGVRLKGEHFSTWKEGRIPFRHGGDHNRNGVFLGWNRATEKPVPVPVYTLELPDGVAGPVLTMALSATADNPPVPKNAKERKAAAANGEKDKPAPPDFTVEMEDAAGRKSALPLTRFAALQPPLDAQFLKWKFLDGKAYKKRSEPVLQTVELPLTAFAANAPGFDPSGLRFIRLKFDRTEKGSIVVADIGFRGLERAPNHGRARILSATMKESPRP